MSVEKVMDSRVEDFAVMGEGEVEILMVVREERGQKHIPLRIWSVQDSGIGIVVEAKAAKFIESFWAAASEAVKEALANAPDECDCDKCNARRELAEKISSIAGSDNPIVEALGGNALGILKKTKMH